MSERGRQVEEVIQDQLAQLNEILNDLIGSREAVAGQDRFDRWKRRTVRLIRENVNEDEASQFENTYVPLVIGVGEVEFLKEAIERHASALTVLLEDLARHPEEHLRELVPAKETLAKVERSPGIEADPRTVFVIHGRDREALEALFAFLRSLDLRPVQWEELVERTNRGSPYTGEVVAQAFREANAVVVLMTPDDEARLHPDLQSDADPEYERTYWGQVRPNVLLEAGMALEAQPTRTIFVEIGRLRPASDLAGINSIRLTGANGPLLALVKRLETAGCPVDTSSEEWMRTDRFESLSALTRAPKGPDPPTQDHLPRGTRVEAQSLKPSPPRLTASLQPRGSDYLMEVSNRGGVTLQNVRWDFPPEAANWGALVDVLPEYPIPELQPREYVRLPVVVTLGGPVVVDIQLSAEDPDGEAYSTSARLSIYG